MKRLLLPVCFLAPSLLLAATPPEKPADPVAITLPLSALGKSIGVEPEGGRFQSVYDPGKPKETSQEIHFTTESRKQGISSLALYASSGDRLRDEKPFARLNIFLLQDGEQKERILVRFTKKGNQILVHAEDAVLHLGLTAVRLQAEALKPGLAKAKTQPGLPPVAARGQKLPPGIGSYDGATPPPAKGSLAETIGVRTAGGIVHPVFPAGTTEFTKSYYIRPRFPDQKTADISLLRGSGSYVENYRLAERYLLSEIPLGEKRHIRVDLVVHPNGKLELPHAFETSTGKDREVHVQKYTASAADKLGEPERTEKPTIARRIPAVPAS